MKKKNNLKSQCCNAEVKVDMSPDFVGDNPKTMLIGTCCWICNKCKQPCDIYFKERKTWTRNPVEQVVPNKKRKKSTKLTPKELKEIHQSQDF